MKISDLETFSIGYTAIEDLLFVVNNTGEDEHHTEQTGTFDGQEFPGLLFKSEGFTNSLSTYIDDYMSLNYGIYFTDSMSSYVDNMSDSSSFQLSNADFLIRGDREINYVPAFTFMTELGSYVSDSFTTFLSDYINYMSYVYSPSDCNIVVRTSDSFHYLSEEGLTDVVCNQLANNLWNISEYLSSGTHIIVADSNSYSGAGYVTVNDLISYIQSH